MTDLAQLKYVSQAIYDRQRHSFAKILAEETAIRSEIARIDGMAKAPIAADQSVAQMQVIGADLLWRSWIARSKTDLNMQLARVLARKAQEQVQVKRAFGRLTALRSLIDAETDARRKTKAQKDLDSAISIAVHNGNADQ